MVRVITPQPGFCLPHLRLALEHIRKRSTSEKLLTIHREKLESLRAELAEFIQKTDDPVIQEGFGKEGDARKRD